MTRVLRLALLLSLAAPTARAADRVHRTGAVPPTPAELRLFPAAPAIPYRDEAHLDFQVDLSRNMPPPGDQGPQASAVGWVVGYAAATYHIYMATGVPFRTEGGKLKQSRVFSPAFIYNLNNNGRDKGISLAAGLHYLQEFGVAPWKIVPYREDDFRTRPTSEMIQAAERNRVRGWRRIEPMTRAGIKERLHDGRPVLVTLGVDASFQKPGTWPRSRAGSGPRVWSKLTGPTQPHPLVVVGYSDHHQAFRVMNCWGTRWADGGYAWISYDLMQAVIVEAYVSETRPTRDLTGSWSVSTTNRQKGRLIEVIQQLDLIHDPAKGEATGKGSLFLRSSHVRGGRTFRVDYDLTARPADTWLNATLVPTRVEITAARHNAPRQDLLWDGTTLAERVNKKITRAAVSREVMASRIRTYLRIRPTAIRVLPDGRRIRMVLQVDGTEAEYTFVRREGGKLPTVEGPPIREAGADDGTLRRRKRRYLVVKNATGEQLTVFVRYYTKVSDGTWVWVKGKWVVEPGERKHLERGGQKLSASQMNIWAEGRSAQWYEFKDSTMSLGKPYTADHTETYEFTFN